MPDVTHLLGGLAPGIGDASTKAPHDIVVGVNQLEYPPLSIFCTLRSTILAWDRGTFLVLNRYDGIEEKWIHVARCDRLPLSAWGIGGAPCPTTQIPLGFDPQRSRHPNYLDSQVDGTCAAAKEQLSYPGLLRVHAERPGLFQTVEKGALFEYAAVSMEEKSSGTSDAVLQNSQVSSRERVLEMSIQIAAIIAVHGVSGCYPRQSICVYGWYYPLKAAWYFFNPLRVRSTMIQNKRRMGSF